MPIKVKVSGYKSGDMARAMLRMDDPMAVAAQSAIKDLAGDLKNASRADIRAAGFSSKWANALRVDTYPKRGVSIDAAAYLYHKIPYSGIFETGGTIRGQPLLWIPLSSTPKKIGRLKMTPENYRRVIGPLFQIKPPGKPPLLVARSKKSRNTKISVSSLKKGASGPSSRSSMVPVFVGVPQVNIRDKFHISEIAAAFSRNLPALYSRYLKDR